MYPGYNRWRDETHMRLQYSIRMRLEAEQGKEIAPEEFADLAIKLASSVAKLTIMEERKVPLMANLTPGTLEREIELLTLAAGKYANRMREFRFHWKDGSSHVGKGLDEADALRRLGYGSGASAALDYVEEITNTVCEPATV